jgi:predicted secreted hydrolase
MCRGIVLGALAAAGVPLAIAITGCGGGGGPVLNEPAPIPASQVGIHLPADQYMHPGAPTEWWWHVGTLKAGDRTFGFEIDAASFAGYSTTPFAFTQIMLTDVSNDKHYQQTTPYIPPALFNVDTWAQQDATKDWVVQLGDPNNFLSAIALTDAGSGYTSAPNVQITGGGGSGAQALALLRATGGTVSEVLVVNPGTGYTSAPTVTLSGGGGTGATAVAYQSWVTMSALAENPTQTMAVKALLTDATTQSKVDFDLQLSQEGAPFMVWGTGMKAANGTTGTALQTHNYYYSLTHLQASGSISIDGQTLDVTGVTWMDHEYGYFGSPSSPIKWLLQDMQLDDGVSISNYAQGDPTTFVLNQKITSNATIQRADGTTYFVPTSVTPIGRTWLSPASNNTYFLQFQVDVPGFDTSLVVTSLVDGQEFPVATSPIYEGIASATGTFEGHQVSGTAWIEQSH